MKNKKSQTGVIEALLLIGILLTAMVFFATQMDRFSSENSDELREKTFREIGNYIVSSGVQSESLWVKREKQTLTMAVPLDSDGWGQNDLFEVEKTGASTIRVTEILGAGTSFIDASPGEQFYIGLDGESDEPTVELSTAIPSGYDEPLNVYMLGEFEFVEFQQTYVEGEIREIVYLQIERRVAVLGIKDNMTNRNYDFEADEVPTIYKPDIFEVLSEMGVKYYPIRYAFREELVDFYTCITVPSSLEGLVANLDSDQEKKDIIKDFISDGGGLMVLSQKYVNSANPHDPTPTPMEELHKNVYDFIPTKIKFNYGNEGIDYNFLQLSGEEILSQGIDSGAVSGYFPTAAGYIEIPETENETVHVLIREDEVESRGTGNTGNYPVMVAQQWGSGWILATTLLLDSRTVITIEVGEQATTFIKPALLTGEHRFRFRDLLDPDHDGVMEYVREDNGGAYIPYLMVEKPVLGNIDIENYCAVIVAGDPPSGMAWGHVKQLYRDGGSILSTGGSNGGLLHGAAEIGMKKANKSCEIGTDVDPSTTTGAIFYDIDTYADAGDEIPLEWDNVPFCNADIMLDFTDFWTFDVDSGEPLNSEADDNDMEEAGYISYNLSSSTTADAKKHVYIKRTNYDTNVVGEEAHHGLFYIGAPLEMMGGYIVEASQSKETFPGETIEYPFTVANYGETGSTFDLSVTSSLFPAGNVKILSAETGLEVTETVYLDPAEDEYIEGNIYYFDGIVQIIVPASTSVNGGDVDTTVLEVKDGATVVGKSVIATTVKEGLLLRPDTQYTYIYETTPEEYTLTAYNLTGSEDVIDLEVAGTGGWTYELLEVNGTALTDSEPDGKVDITVPLNSSYDFVLKVTPPASSPGDSSTAVVTATSSNDTNNVTSAEVVTTYIDDTVYDPSSAIDEIIAPSATRYEEDPGIESSAEKIGRFYGKQIEDIMTESVKLVYRTIIGIDFGGGNTFWVSLGPDNTYIQIDQDDNQFADPPQYDEKGYNLPAMRGGYPEGGEEGESGAQANFFIDEEKTYIENLFEIILYVRERKVNHDYILNDVLPGPGADPLPGTELELLNEENVKLFRNMLIYITSQVTSMKKEGGPKILLDLDRTIGKEHYRIIGEGNTVKIIAEDDASVYSTVDTQGIYVTGQVNTAVSERVYIGVTAYGVYIWGE